MQKYVRQALSRDFWLFHPSKSEMLAFTESAERLTQLGAIAQILAGFGVVTVLLAVAKWHFERICWRGFKLRVHAWVDRLRETENRHPRDLGDDQWKAECERMLAESRFSPLAIPGLLDLSVTVARGIAAEKFFS